MGNKREKNPHRIVFWGSGAVHLEGGAMHRRGWKIPRWWWFGEGIVGEPARNDRLGGWGEGGRFWMGEDFLRGVVFWGSGAMHLEGSAMHRRGWKTAVLEGWTAVFRYLEDNTIYGLFGRTRLDVISRAFGDGQGSGNAGMGEFNQCVQGEKNDMGRNTYFIGD